MSATLTNAVTVTILSEMLVGIYDAPIGGRPQWAIELENDNVAAAEAIIDALESKGAERGTMSLVQWAWDNKTLVKIAIQELEAETWFDVQPEGWLEEAQAWEERALALSGEC